jgi:hypothetical protein
MIIDNLTIAGFLTAIVAAAFLVASIRSAGKQRQD